MTSDPTLPPSRPTAGWLALASAASVFASACCVLPLVLAIVGISGAWIGRLRVFAPYSPGLSLLAVIALGVAAWQIFSRRPGATSAGKSEGRACDVGAPSTCSRDRSVARRWFWLAAALTLVPIVVPLAAPLFY